VTALPRPWVAICQPNYVPWLGYFDMIDAVDEFILLDTVQYTKRDWRNRNRIKTSGGVKWMTIPIKAPSGTLIEDVGCANLDWRPRHLAQLDHAYREAGCYDDLMPRIVDWYDALAGTSLAGIDEHLIRAVMDTLGVDTPLRRASAMRAPDEPTERLVELCRAVGAGSYVSGPSARDYLDVARFQKAGIAVGWINYAYDYEYAQPYPPFERHVSVLDTLLCIGGGARRIMRSRAGDFVTPHADTPA
jgi:hypothetical protein